MRLYALEGSGKFWEVRVMFSNSIKGFNPTFPNCVYVL